jgi:hypothetical protein
MTVTLQDIAMIADLPIEGNPLCMSTDSDGWREQMHALIGMVPPEPREPESEDKNKERVVVGAPFTWIAWNFGTFPEDANEDEVKTYARVYMWYVISRTMFADGTGKNAPWMWLKALTVFDSKWSWGSATLAYLYRQVESCFFFTSLLHYQCDLPVNSTMFFFMCSWMKHVVGNLEVLVVVCSHFLYGAGNDCRLDDRRS